MAHNSIIERVADELGEFPPFDMMARAALEKLAASVRIAYRDAGELLFREGEAPLPHIFWVKDGRVDLYREDQHIDTCEPGDLVGVRSMLTGNNYLLEGRIFSPSLIYEISLHDFEPLVKENPGISLFFARGLAAGQSTAPDYKAVFQTPVQQQIGSQVVHGAELITCSPDASIAEAAKIMSENQIGSLVIAGDNGHPAGIITDTDFRKKVATGIVPVNALVGEIMSGPVITAPVDIPVYELLILMLENNIHHICLTSDGTRHSRGIYMVSERDLITVQENHPALLNKKLRNAADNSVLRRICDQSEQLLGQYLEQEVSTEILSGIISSLHDGIIARAIRIVLERKKNNFQSAFRKNVSWVALGSLGRKEQLLRTDLDSAIIHSADGSVGRELPGFAEDVIEILTNCGFRECPAQVMASNPDWCLSPAEWEEKFRLWFETPDEQSLMQASTFLDMRLQFGDHQPLDKVRQSIRNGLEKESAFHNFLAGHATKNPPPVGFFKQLILEKEGSHEHEFDIKARVMAPLSDAARVLSISYGQLEITNTAERFRWLAKKETTNEVIFSDAAEAYNWIMRLRAKSGLMNRDEGRYIQIDQLDKRQKRLLRNCFEPINKLQELLSVRFQLDYIRS